MSAPKSFMQLIGLASKETTFGVAQSDASLIDWLAVMEAGFADLNIGWRTNEGEINGFVGVTEHQEQSRSVTVPRDMQASAESITWACAFMTGVVTSSGTTPNYTHVIKQRSICAVNPPSFSFLEVLQCASVLQAGTAFIYKGCVVDQISVEVSGKGFVKLTVTYKTDGTETAKATFTLPSAVNAVNKFVGASLTLLCGSVGNENLTAVVRSLKWTLTMGAVEPPNIGTVAVTEYQFEGNSPKLDIDLVIKGDKSHALYTLYKSGLATGIPTKVILDALLQFDANRSVRVHCSQGIIMSASVKGSGNENQLTVKYSPEDNVTDSGPFVITGKTATATYLNAA